MTNMKPALIHDAYTLAHNQMRRGTYSDAQGVLYVAATNLWPRYKPFFSAGEFGALIEAACEIAQIERDLEHGTREPLPVLAS